MKVLSRLLSAAAAAAVCLVLAGTTTAAADPTSLEGGTRLYVAGPWLCTAAFNVRLGTVGFMVMPGDCGEVGDSVDGPGHVPIGVVTAKTQNSTLDVILVRVNNTEDWQQGPWVSGQGGPTVTITGSTAAPIGAQVRMSGPASGTRTGVVSARNATINTAEGPLNGLTRTSICAAAGDLGAPVYAGGQAQGYVIGGSACQTYILPINPVLAAYQLQLF
ncbi:S1 family peptidase [Actinophytocola sp.]|uniref:S1 family peptidase n=1 Tax=Actinophytocola sp. TaxID=1872138 RepID=UPI00389ADEE1